MKYHNKKALNLCKEMKRYEGSHIAIRMHLFFDNIWKRDLTPLNFYNDKRKGNKIQWKRWK